MDESEHNRRTKHIEALLLAAQDMDDAAAAGRALYEDTSDDENFRRSLETGMAVSYMRAFTSSDKRLPNEYVPDHGHDADVHAVLKDLRDKLYAHTDKEGGRTATLRTTAESGDVVSLEYKIGWLAFPVEEIPDLLAFFARRKDQFQTAAASLHVDMEGERG
jgi:hypothetical protein